jgi:putative ABC transport system substrate-binding protein
MLLRPVRIAFAVVGLLLASPGLGQGQPQTLRVGLIGFNSAELRQSYEASLIEGLHERGYVEGKNLELVRRYADGQPARVGQIASELAGLKLDAVVTTCTPTTTVMHKATKTTPLVMAAVSDPVGAGLIKSYARPGGNITGLATQFEDIVGKMLQLFIETVPRASPVVVLYNTKNPVHQKFLKELALAAAPLKLRLLPVEVSLQTDVGAAIGVAAQRGAASVLALPDDTLVGNFRRQIIGAAAKHRMASFFGYREAVEDGALMSYGESRRRTYYRVAYYLDKLAKGAEAAALPVEQPTRFELAVNLRTAKALGIEIPPAVLLRADQVIE